jgi:hypothetical protein
MGAGGGSFEGKGYDLKKLGIRNLNFVLLGNHKNHLEKYVAIFVELSVVLQITMEVLC